MTWNYYEEANKTASVLSVMKHLNLNNRILCNEIWNIEELYSDIEKVYYTTINELDLETINEILKYHLSEPEIKTIDELSETTAQDIETEYNYYYGENYQYFIIPESDIKYYHYVLNYDIFYCSLLDLYILGVNHYGTSWDYILSDIPLIYSDEPEPEQRELIIDIETIQKKIEASY